ncbi:synaptotagmin-15-like isoform X3 [Daphnia pulicaria]|uniref:synaptotagmin-15-like isoform X3 n=1 Tax=Daphnia pulicaria TaxID=35523 RepID=UPI001EEAB4ED|nr:synaptotagmin-15-like isoform X3 [Daphnia pulicaria]
MSNESFCLSDRKRLNSPCHQELSLLRRLELDVVTRRWISRQRTGRPCHRATPILGTTLGTTSVKDVSRRRCFSPAELTVPPRLFFHLPSFSTARLRRRPFPTTRRRRLIRPVSRRCRRYTLAFLFNFFRERSPSPARSRTPSPAKEVSPPTTSSRNSPVLSGVTSNIGSINPDLYKNPLIPEEDTSNYPEGHLGRFWFSINYDLEQEKLLINLIRIHNLPSRDKDSTTACDPLVRVALLPGERRYHQSSIQRKTCNPVFNEVFGFCVSHKELQEQTVKFTVIDNGRLRKRQIIGHLLCSLKNISIEDGKQQIITQDITKDPSVVGSPGEMHLSLCYHPSADRFTVTVLQARNIRAPNTATPDSYVRLTLFNQTRAVKTKRTGIIRRSADPCYNESFHFRLETANVDTTNIVLAIHQPDNKDRILGRLVLGSFMFARGRGMAHWNDMFARPREHVQLWHPLPDLN